MKPYRIAVSDAVLDDLRHRLARSRWHDGIPGAGGRYGADLAYLKDLCDYWQRGFNWRLQEERLNRIPQFMALIDGIDLHFIHVRSPQPNAMPLLLLHGWPGSIVEFLGVITPLTAAGFDLVIPSVPGFGFGGQPREAGWGVTRMAAAFNHLMTQVLGYRRYGVQGGDLGYDARRVYRTRARSTGPGAAHQPALRAAARRPRSRSGDCR